MARSFDGSYAPDTLPALPCGGIPEFDEGSGYAYRCGYCGTIIGSISMPKDCYDLMKAKEKENDK